MSALPGATAGAAPTGGTGAQPETGAGQSNGHPEAKAGETKAQTLARLKADLGDGEQEYEQSHLIELARRGKKTAQIMSKAEARAQEAMRKEQEAEARLSRLNSKDWKERRAALTEMGWDEVEYAKLVAQEVTEADALTPEQRRIRELEQKLQADEQTKAKSKKEEEAKAFNARKDKYTDEFSGLFLEVMQRAGLPRESATASFYRLAAKYQAADAAGAQLDPDVAAESLKHELRAEHTALFRKKDGTLDLDAFEATLSPEDWKALNKRAVEKYLAARGGGKQPQPRQTEEAPEQPETPGRGRPGNFWKQLDRQMRR